MKINLKVLSLAILVLSLSACTSKEVIKTSKIKDYELVITHFNDVHARVYEGPGIGYAKIATVVEDLKADNLNKNVMVLDAGDSLHGTTFATLERGDSIAKVLDKIGVTAMALGNHDFNYGSARTEELNANTKMEMLATNVVKKNGKNFTKPYIIKEIEGKKVGIFGLSTPETSYKTNPNNVTEIKFLEPIETAQKTVKELKALGVEFIIVLSHLGDDESTKKEWKSTTLAEKVEGINLIIDGHSHTVRESKEVINNTVLVQTGEYGKNLGVLKIDFDTLNQGAEAIEYTLMKKDQVTGVKNAEGKIEGGVIENKEVAEYILKIKTEQNKITETVIGKTEVKLIGDRDAVRTSETNLSNLITDAMVWKSGSDMSLTNGGGIRASIEAGNITVGDVITVLPFGNYVITKELTGSDIKKALEHGLKNVPNSAGSMAQFGGITLDLDLTKPEGQKVSNIKFKNKKKFDLNAKYKVATNDFMAVGGDGYSSFKGKKEIANYPGLDEVLVEYIKEKGITSKNSDKRLKIKK
ncbi:MAG: bifunctional metallophosphatase/5'-nucleotidase [Fusobacteriaceae bacterium]